LSARVLRKDPECSAGQDSESHSATHLFTLTTAFTVARHRGELRLVLPNAALTSGKGNSSLLKAIVRAQRWKQRIIDGEIYSKEQLASEAKLNASYAGRILRLAALRPASINAVVHQRNGSDQPLSEVLNGIPLDWRQQEKLLPTP
jgi:hypothetical protein